jgi:hypothetical protein
LVSVVLIPNGWLCVWPRQSDNELESVEMTLVHLPQMTAFPVRRSGLNPASLSGVQFAGLKEDLEALAAQKKMEAYHNTLTGPRLCLGDKVYSGLQLLEFAQSFEAEAKNNPQFKSFKQWLFFQSTPLGLFDMKALARLLNQATDTRPEGLEETYKKLKNAFGTLLHYEFVSCPKSINGKDGKDFSLWIITEKGKAALAQSQFGVETLSVKAEAGLNDISTNASLELTAKRIRIFAQAFGQHGLSGLHLAESLESATRKKGWWSGTLYYQPVSLNGFLKNFSAQKEIVKSALLEMETLGLLTRDTNGAEPTIALSEVGMKLVNQLHGKDAMKVSAKTFQVVIQQEIAERKDAIAKVEQDMSAWGQKIETLEKERLVQDAELEKLRKTATALATQLQSITEPSAYQQVNEKLKVSVLALRFAEVKAKAEATHLNRLTQRYEAMKIAFQRWESTQMSQMQRLMEMQKELELKVSFDQVSERLRGQTAQGDQDFNALFQTLLRLDQEGVLATSSIQDARAQDQAALVKQGADQALLETEQLCLVESFLKEISDTELDQQAASEGPAATKKASA